MLEFVQYILSYLEKIIACTNARIVCIVIAKNDMEKEDVDYTKKWCWLLYDMEYYKKQNPNCIR